MMHGDFEHVPIDTSIIPWVLHIPLVKNGLVINMICQNKINCLNPFGTKIPFGSGALLRGDVLHGGSCLNKRGTI